MCYWKEVYMKASVLMSNWRYGVYSVAPLLRGHKSSITALSVEGRLSERNGKFSEDVKSLAVIQVIY